MAHCDNVHLFMRLSACRDSHCTANTITMTPDWPASKGQSRDINRLYTAGMFGPPFSSKPAYISRVNEHTASPLVVCAEQTSVSAHTIVARPSHS
ncbi:unnamed protein product [Protopolystoma xenopodis]|uniref:Uncharacterized protein n=1 Tax=Protopolystoma xenopodis TaxID=117903 RepID=A0A3S5CEZ3_9PLAT|nr:unnamed protein product [Protopolystoma xenopodis]